MTDKPDRARPVAAGQPLLPHPTSELHGTVETVLGPGSALYGPNAANGVIHYMTKSPIRSPGASFSVGGGMRQQGDDAGLGSGPIQGEDAGLFQFDGRIAVAPSDKFGFKVSAQYFDATEYVFNDLVEAQRRQAGEACIAAQFDPTSAGLRGLPSGLDLTTSRGSAVLAQPPGTWHGAATGTGTGPWTPDGLRALAGDIAHPLGRTELAAQATNLSGLGRSNVHQLGIT